jgi:hypothetical protein
MNKFEDIIIERDYPWLVRFTENIFRDAPIQYNVYHMWLPKYQDKQYRLRNEEMARAHEHFRLYYHELVVDLLEEGEDRMRLGEAHDEKFFFRQDYGGF